MACQITLSEREQVAQFRSQGLSKAEIARRLAARLDIPFCRAVGKLTAAVLTERATAGR